VPNHFAWFHDLHAQAKPNPERRACILQMGKRLIGHFEELHRRVSAKFKSDTLGEVTVALSKIQELSHLAKSSG